MPPLSEFPGAEGDQETGQDPPAIRVPPPGPMSLAAVARLERVECPAFSRRRAARAAAGGIDMAPIVLSSAMGCNLHDVDGNRYVDLAAGFGAVLLGHQAVPVVRAIEGQADVQADSATNTLVIRASPRDYEAIRNVIDSLDRARPQVLIKTLIAEVTLDDELRYGAEG
ncbi:MAG: aminotransferase class III-fold pyridoxal phosphate-dependent enzyme, partial [Deltaproteobacteria bacterium]|nr:aminotransferase class III-fold pyridoxal phosphate-dependent enzyme [Deltaproteobacteria bacterium]